MAKTKTKKKATGTPDECPSELLYDLARGFTAKAKDKATSVDDAKVFDSAAATIKAVAEHLETHNL